VTPTLKLRLLLDEINNTPNPELKRLAKSLVAQDSMAAIVAYDALVYLSQEKGFRFHPGFLVDHILETLTSQPTLNEHSDLWFIAEQVAQKAMSEEPRFKIPEHHVVLQRALDAHEAGVYGAISFARTVNPEYVVADVNHVIHHWR